MQIRIAIEGDLEALAQLFDAYRQDLGQETNLGASSEFICARLTENDSVIFLAIENDKPVGFIQLYPSFSSMKLKPLWYFDDVFVTEKYRRCGIARQLITKAKALADETQVLAVRRAHVNVDGFLPIELSDVSSIFLSPPRV